jgi:hypothetical protein
MNKQYYKKAASEHREFQDPINAIKHHMEMAMAHAFLFIENEEEQNRVMHAINMSLVEVISPKEAQPISKAKAIEKAPAVDLFTDVPESIEIPEDNVIDEVPVPVVVKTVIIGESEKIVVPEQKIARGILIQDSMLSSRAKIVLGRTSLQTIDDLMGMNNKQLDKLKGVGSTTVSEIIGRLKKYYGLHLTILEKEPTQKEKRAAKKIASQKAHANTPHDDGAGRIAV